MNPFHRITKKALWVLYLLTIAILRLLYPVLGFFYNLSGLKHILEMARIRKPNAPDYEPPPTLVLRIIGIYAGLYGIAATNY